MARKLKPYKVSEHSFPDGSLFEVLLDREEKKFFAHVLGERVIEASERECTLAAQKTWQQLVNIEWKKIVVVRVCGSRPANERGVYLSYTVHEVGQSNAGHWMERRPNPHYGRGSGPEFLRQRYNGHKESDPKYGVHVLPWAEGLEQSLASIRTAILDVRERLEAVLSHNDAVAMLLHVKGLALPPPTEEKEES